MVVKRHGRSPSRELRLCARAEVGSRPYRDVVGAVLPRLSKRAPVLSLTTRVPGRLFAERDLSAQEVAFFLFRLPLQESSRESLAVDCRPEAGLLARPYETWVFALSYHGVKCKWMVARFNNRTLGKSKGKSKEWVALPPSPTASLVIEFQFSSHHQPYRRIMDYQSHKRKRSSESNSLGPPKAPRFHIFGLDMVGTVDSLVLFFHEETTEASCIPDDGPMDGCKRDPGLQLTDTTYSSFASWSSNKSVSMFVKDY
ncbi:hypothetical protein F4819DRAFT_483711 [Hypoxylon fuscum]|nr:hypothetical protein F4819DRAFT_483711 [Hypoxylon fuscum]